MDLRRSQDRIQAHFSVPGWVHTCPHCGGSSKHVWLPANQAPLKSPALGISAPGRACPLWEGEISAFPLAVTTAEQGRPSSDPSRTLHYPIQNSDVPEITQEEKATQTEDMRLQKQIGVLPLPGCVALGMSPSLPRTLFPHK